MYFGKEHTHKQIYQGLEYTELMRGVIMCKNLWRSQCQDFGIEKQVILHQNVWYNWKECGFKLIIYKDDPCGSHSVKIKSYIAVFYKSF